MSGDDLRARALEAARARLGPFPPMSNAEADGYECGYVDGFLAAHEQLPGRDEIARALMMRRGSVLIGPTTTNPSPIDYRDADAVLALIRGGQS